MKLSDRGSSQKLGPVIKEVLVKLPAFAPSPVGDWKELVGEQVARYTRPKSLKKKILIVAAHDSVWKHHLEQYKEVLVEKINGKRKDPIVDEIVIKVADIPDSEPPLNPAYKSLEKVRGKKTPSRRHIKTPSRKLTPEEKNLVSSMVDPELKELASKLLRRIPVDGE